MMMETGSLTSTRLHRASAQQTDKSHKIMFVLILFVLFLHASNLKPERVDNKEYKRKWYFKILNTVRST